MSLHAPLLVPIWVPILAGLVVAVLPRRGAAEGASRAIAEIAAIAVTILAAVWGVLIWASPATLGSVEQVTRVVTPAWDIFRSRALEIDWTGQVLFSVDSLSGFAGAAAGLLALIMTVYAVGFSRQKGASALRLYSGILLSVGATFGSLYAENLVVLAIFWGFLGIPFFMLLSLGSDDAPAAAKKAFIIVGGTDSLLVLGIALVWIKTGRLTFGGGALSTSFASLAVAYACFLAAALAKAGAIPLHSWIPGAAASAPVPAVALLPASLDKILGIYLLARVSLELFALTPFLKGLVMVLGAVTILAAVFMALVQHNLRKLLGFHAVSQVGYMVLGIGTGTFVGVAGGLFHMLNNAIYKSCLFLTAGSAERKAGTGEIGRMGGLAKLLPVSFVCAIIAALAISGVPPLNGFVSKWMVYQGVVEFGQAGASGLGSHLWVVLLAAAVLGSALTLASFVKVLYGVYLAQRLQDEPAPAGEGENLLTRIPMIALALACVVFGVAAFLPLSGAILPAAGVGSVKAVPKELWAGFWQPSLATGLILVGLAVGVLIYIVGTVAHAREDAPYTGAEVHDEDFRFSGGDFYETMTRVPPLASLYERAEKKVYDLYEWGRRLVEYAGKALRALHGGVLYQYVTWTVVGMVVLLWLLMRRG